MGMFILFSLYSVSLIVVYVTSEFWNWKNWNPCGVDELSCFFFLVLHNFIFWNFVL